MTVREGPDKDFHLKCFPSTLSHVALATTTQVENRQLKNHFQCLQRMPDAMLTLKYIRNQISLNELLTNFLI